MANVSVSNITLSAIVSVTVSVASYSASAAYTDVIYSTDGASVSYNYEVIETRPLAAEQLSVSESISKQANKSPSDDVTLSDSDPTLNIQLNKTDSVTMIESRVKVFTDFIDFDPSDDDVDATPVTMTESSAKSLTIGELADNDDVTASESISKEPAKPGITASVSTAESINSFHFGKTFSDTATSSEEINRIDVTTVLADDVTVTEATAKTITPAGKTDSVTAVQSNVKAFNSSIDFDLSDADVDPDPVTASEQINLFSLNKGLSETLTATESTAKNFTHGGFSDTASPVESTAFTVNIPGVTDSLSAVEGIKLEPSKPFGHSVSASESVALNPRPVFSHAVSATESINTSLILGESSYLYPDFVVASDGSGASKLPGYHIGTTKVRVSTLPNFSYQLNEDLTMFNEDVVFGTSLDAVQYYNRIHLQDRTRFRSNDFSAQVGHDGSLLNSALIWDIAVDSIGRVPFTGVIGAAEQINMAVLNSDTITYGDETNAGLIVNFMYTDTQDPEVGGHYLNETPLCAGAY